jgi:hypothetical protein
LIPVKRLTRRALSLDAEIRVLKGQRASKLRTQNAQLKKMLASTAA